MSSKEWKKCKLGDICIINMGQSPKSEFYNSKGEGLPFLQGNRTFGFMYPDFDTYTTQITKTAEPMDVIMSVRAPVGELNIVSNKVCIGRGVCSIKIKNGQQKFLYYFMKHYISHLINQGNGTVFGSVNKNDISNLEVLLPPIETQEKIARVLSSLDDKIELNNKINQNLEQQAQAIFKSWFVDFEPFGGKMPEDWKVGNLYEIANVTMGQSPDGKSYNENGYGEVFYQGRAEFGSRYPTRRLYTTEPKRMANAGDILMSVRAPVGDINVALEKCCIGRGLASISSRDNFNSFILYTLMNLKRSFDIYNAEGTVFGAINKDSLNSIEVIIPTKEEIYKFEEIVSNLDKMIRQNTIEVQKLQKIRDTLLPKLMSGEIDVSKVEV